MIDFTVSDAAGSVAAGASGEGAGVWATACTAISAAAAASHNGFKRDAAHRGLGAPAAAGAGGGVST